MQQITVRLFGVPSYSPTDGAANIKTDCSIPMHLIKRTTWKVSAVKFKCLLFYAMKEKKEKIENEKFYACCCVCGLYIMKGGIRLLMWLTKKLTSPLSKTAYSRVDKTAITTQTTTCRFYMTR